MKNENLLPNNYLHCSNSISYYIQSHHLFDRIWNSSISSSPALIALEIKKFVNEDSEFLEYILRILHVFKMKQHQCIPIFMNLSMIGIHSSFKLVNIFVSLDFPIILSFYSFVDPARKYNSSFVK